MHTNDYDHAVPPESLTDSERTRRAVFTSTRYETVHPVVRVRIVGLSGGESRDILRLLQRYVTRPDNVLWVTWEPGQLVLFDNRITQHYAPGNYDGAPRRLNRVTVAGDIPVGIDGQLSFSTNATATRPATPRWPADRLPRLTALAGPGPPA